MLRSCPVVGRSTRNASSVYPTTGEIDGRIQKGEFEVPVESLFYTFIMINLHEPILWQVYIPVRYPPIPPNARLNIHRFHHKAPNNTSRCHLIPIHHYEGFCYYFCLGCGLSPRSSCSQSQRLSEPECCLLFKYVNYLLQYLNVSSS